MSLRTPYAPGSTVFAARAEIAGIDYPIRGIDGDHLTLGNYWQPGRPGDQLRLTLHDGCAELEPIQCLAVLIRQRRITGELCCRLPLSQPAQAIALRRLADHLPPGTAGPPLPLPLALPWPAGVAGLLALGLAASLGWLALDGIRQSLAAIRLDTAMIALPAGPVVASVEPVVARERGLIDQIYGREGMLVAPGQPLFSTRYDPRIDLDLLDRSAARDLAQLDARLRDAQAGFDSLAERIALQQKELTFFPRQAAFARLTILEQQLSLAREQQRRRLRLLREGGISQDSYDVTVDRVLELETRQQQAREQDRLDRARRGRLQALLALQRLQGRQLVALMAARRQLQQGMEQRRALRRQVPLPLYALPNPSRDQQIVKASAAAVILRQLKQPGATVQPNEAVLVIQKKQLPPYVQADASAADRAGLSPGSLGTAEIAAIRQTYPVRLTGIQRKGSDSYGLRFDFVDLQANDQRQIEALQGKAVRLRVHSTLNWLQRLRPWLLRSQP